MDFSHELRVGIVGVAVVKAVDAGQDDEIGRTDHLRDLGREPIVVADADFLRRDRVVFVHDRHDPGFQQAVDRIARIEEAAVILEIAQRQKNLCDLEAEFVTDLLVRIQEERHAASGSGLFIGNASAFGRFTNDTQAKRDRPGGTHDYIPPFGPQMGNILHHPLEETIAGGQKFLVCEQRGADLYNDGFGFGHNQKVIQP